MVTTTKYTDAYNIAVQYLKDKYGIKLTCATHNRSNLRFATKKQRKETVLSYTDSDYNATFNEPNDHSDIEISLLLKQYYYSESVKVELKNKLVELGLL